MRSLAFAPLTAALALSAGPVSAHLNLTFPPPRTTSLKSGPCGAQGSTRGTAVSTFLPGQTITVTWDEFVDHPGHFRIAFDDEGDDIFVDPQGFDDVSGGPGVLLDGIADRSGGGVYSQEITLPDIECDNCTLQVIQVMSDKAPYGDGNDMYYQCADLVLSADAEPDENPMPATTAEPPVEPDDEGCGCRSGGTVAAIGLLVLPLLGWRRRRPRG